jgi:hypothetical protein
MVLIPHEYYSYCYKEPRHQIYGGIESKYPLHFILIGYVYSMKTGIYEVSRKVIVITVIFTGKMLTYVTNIRLFFTKYLSTEEHCHHPSTRY